MKRDPRVISIRTGDGSILYAPHLAKGRLTWIRSDAILRADPKDMEGAQFIVGDWVLNYRLRVFVRKADATPQAKELLYLVGNIVSWGTS